MIRPRGTPVFREVDHRLMSLKLVQLELSDGRVVFYQYQGNRPPLVTWKASTAVPAGSTDCADCR